MIFVDHFMSFFLFFVFFVCSIDKWDTNTIEEFLSEKLMP